MAIFVPSHIFLAPNIRFVLVMQVKEQACSWFKMSFLLHGSHVKLFCTFFIGRVYIKDLGVKCLP